MIHRRTHLHALLALLLLAVPAPVPADPAPAERQTVDDATLEQLLKLQVVQEEKVRLVLVPASVEDRRGRTVRGLAQQDFRLLEDQIPQTISYFDREADEPVSVAFLLDVSGSMRQSGKLTAAKEAIRHFVQNLRPRDRFALIAFADEQVAWITPFTSDPVLFRERLEVQEGYGQTALHDAVAATPALVDREVLGRKAIILFTDGVDNRSTLTVREAIQHARRVHVPIHTIAFSSLPESVLRKNPQDTNLEVLEKFSHETGGAVYVVNDPDVLKEAVAQIDEELRFQYLIGYYPKRQDWDGRFRRIQVQTDRTRLIVRARQGYYANP